MNRPVQDVSMTNAESVLYFWHSHIAIDQQRTASDYRRHVRGSFQMFSKSIIRRRTRARHNTRPNQTDSKTHRDKVQCAIHIVLLSLLRPVSFFGCPTTDGQTYTRTNEIKHQV